VFRESIPLIRVFGLSLIVCGVVAGSGKAKGRDNTSTVASPFSPVELASSGKTKQRRCFAHLESVTIACIAAVISPVL